MTLNQFMGLLESVAGAHLQIKGYTEGALTELPKKHSEKQLYPHMLVSIGGAEVRGKVLHQGLTLSFIDIVSPDERNEQEIWNDMQLVALDIIAQLRDDVYADDFVLDELSRLEPLENQTADNVSGWRAEITVQLPYSADRCAVPSTLVPQQITPECEPVRVVNSAGTVLHEEIPAGGTALLNDVTLTEADITTSTHPGGIDIAAKEIYFRKAITIKAGSTIPPAYKVDFIGKLKKIELTNISSCDVERNRFATLTNLDTSVTNDVAHDDVISIKNAVITDPNNDATVVLTFYHDPVEEDELVIPDEGGNGQYLYVLNYVDQTVSVIDLATDLVTATIALPVGFNYRTLCYRNVDECVYVFGLGQCSLIDADPASLSFNTITSSVAYIGFAGQVYTSFYDWCNDKFIIGSQNISLVFDAKTMEGVNLNFGYILQGTRNNFLYYIWPTNTYYYGDVQSGPISINARTLYTSGGLGIDINGAIAYSNKYGLLYHSGNNTVFARDIWFKQLQETPSNGFRSSGLTILDQHNLCLGTHTSSNLIGVLKIDVWPNVSLASLSKTSMGSNETGSRGIIYSSNTDRVYIQATNNAGATTGVDKIHKINPSTLQWESAIQVGNMMSDNSDQYYQHQLALNRIQL